MSNPGSEYRRLPRAACVVEQRHLERREEVPQTVSRTLSELQA